MTQVYSDESRSPTFSLTGFAPVKRIWNAAIEIRNRRRLRNELSGLTARRLRDVGLIGQDLTHVSHSPLSSDAGQKIQHLARQRSSNW